MRQEDIVNHLREHGPMTAHELAEAEYDGRSSLSALRCGALSALHRLEKWGTVRKYQDSVINGGIIYRWELVE